MTTQHHIRTGRDGGTSRFAGASSPCLPCPLFALSSEGGKTDNPVSRAVSRASSMGWRRKLRWALHHMLPWPDNTGACTFVPYGKLFLPDFDRRPGQPGRRLKAGFIGCLGPRDYYRVTARDGCIPSSGVLDPDPVLDPEPVLEQQPAGRGGVRPPWEEGGSLHIPLPLD
eukprot:gene10251-biopygen19793